MITSSSDIQQTDNPCIDLSQEQNIDAFETLLEQIEEASSAQSRFTGSYQRNKGTRFETLSRLYFLNEPTYKGLFSEVDTFADWAAKHPELSVNAKDIGIDLVATLADNSGYAAIQCKFYGKNQTVSKGEIDSFLAASSKLFFTQRYIIATNEKWNDNVINELHNSFPPVSILTRETLARSAIDWTAYLKNDNDVKLLAPRKPRGYQIAAIRDVVKGLEEAGRGKLIMACGTGKTFTSMKVVEEMEGKGGFVMFLVPSLSLLSQTLSDWKQNCKFPINAYAVCSDSKTGMADLSEIDNLLSVTELNYPATTDPKILAEKVRKDLLDKDSMTVIFSTYQSIDIVHQAQHDFGLPEIGLTICDEAHRTAGGYLVDKDAPVDSEESHFTRIHNNNYIRSKKRLYMTATPKIYGKTAKQQEKDGEAVIYSMDDETVFGKTLHEITFREAVALGSLVDYKVIVLTISQDVAGNILTYDATQNGGISISNYAKIIGTWRALTKQDLQNNPTLGDDIQQMKRAVGFAQVINPKEKGDSVASRQFAEHFQHVIEDYKGHVKEKLIEKDGNIDEEAFHAEFALTCDTRHIDGTMNANEKGALLDWLRATPEEDHCKILFNVRCLSEGVDVPALDAVIFLSPRRSQVDVVQTVGRVMRTSQKTNKKRGYVIIPIVTPPQVEADLVLNNNREFDTVWQVLKALRSIDPEFGAIVDGQLKKIDTDKIEVISLTEKVTKKAKRPPSPNPGPKKKKTKPKTKDGTAPIQGELTFDHDHILEEELKARIVKKVGNVREWEEWAADVGALCQEQIKHLKTIVSDPANTRQVEAFESFHKELKATINDAMSADDALEMLGQHIVTKPVLDALFSEYPFTEQNPISKALTGVLDVLDKKEMETSSKQLKDFYDSVKFRAKNITNLAERQIVVRELFEKFFKIAFPKAQDKLGIVFTPEPIVDFINQSVADLMKQEFGVSLADKGIHILDPFTGTGTFLTRMMQKGLIPLDNLPQKFNEELHANEIVPLAYYVASMNLEATFHDLIPNSEYKPNNIMVWTDTFADNQKTDMFKTTLAENNARLAKQNAQDIRIIIGNPPYSVGQESQNDDNQNEHYEQLDKRLSETYVARTDATLKGKLFDSYIRAYRWASDRIGNKGIIGFVTNAGWLDTSSADGMRKCLAEEFSSIYVYHLKGNARTVGEQRRKEKGNVFGSGSRAPVAIVLLVKNPDTTEQGRIYFNTVDDYLTAEEKLAQVTDNGSVINMDWQTIIPDSHGDWLNQRDDSYGNFMRMDNKRTTEKAIFKNFSLGVITSRDSWAYNSSAKAVKTNMGRSISFYNQQVKEAQSYSDFEPDLNPKAMKWDRPQKKGLGNQRLSEPYEIKQCYVSSYRPFIKQHLYFDRFWNNCVYQMPQLFPQADSENLVIAVTGIGAKDFCCLITDKIPCYDYLEKSQCFPRYIYTEDTKQQKNDLFAGEQSMGRKDAITPEALAHFRQAYPGHEADITVDALFYYIYGILHSEDYRKRYANNLIKELPRIPRVATYEQFKAFSEAGKKLADLHVNYESVPEYQGASISYKDPNNLDKFRVSKMKYGKIPGKTGNAGKDKTKIIYNSNITIEGIPLEAQEYVVNKRSALDWILERADYRVDKVSGIVNDFNDYAKELGDPRYPLSLVLRIITVSIETMKIVKALPPLEIHPLDR